MCNIYITLPYKTYLNVNVSRVVWHARYLKPPVSHQLYVYLSSCIGFQLYIVCNLNWLLLDNVLFLLNNRHTYLICYILLISPRPLDHPVFVRKIKLNFGKRDLSLAAPKISPLLLNLLKL